MRNILLSILLLFPILQVYAETKQENETSRTVKLVVSGEGITKDEAIKVALRSAIEQAFGTFVSSNTDILNDDIIKDEIATVASGNIQSYKELSMVDLGSSKVVNIEAIVSIGKLVSFARSKGVSAELAGATFAMNMKMKELNKINEKKVLDNLYKQMEMIIDNSSLFDYELVVGNPYQADDGYYGVDVNVVMIPNKNMAVFWELYFNTINSIKLTKNEINDLNNVNLPTYTYFSGYHYRYEKDNERNLFGEKLYHINTKTYKKRDIVLRNEYGDYNELSQENNLFYELSFPFFKSMCNFKIIDNIGNEFKMGFADGTIYTEPSIWSRTPYKDGVVVFCYKNNNKYKVDTIGFEIEKLRYQYVYDTYRMFMDSLVRSKTKIKWSIKLKYLPDDLMKISSLNIVPSYDKIKYFDYKSFNSLK